MIVFNCPGSERVNTYWSHNRFAARKKEVRTELTDPPDLSHYYNQ